MNDIRAKYFWQIGHFMSGHPDNLEKVNETFLRSLEERGGIDEEDVVYWRYQVHKEFLAGKSDTLDRRMGWILRDIGQVD